MSPHHPQAMLFEGAQWLSTVEVLFRHPKMKSLPTPPWCIQARVPPLFLWLEKLRLTITSVAVVVVAVVVVVVAAFVVVVEEVEDV